MNNRPDLLTEATLVRAFKIYLGLSEVPYVVLTKPTTQITIDPSVIFGSFRWNKLDHSLQLPFSETWLLMKRHTKRLLQLKKSFMILFVEPESMHQLELMIWILLKAHSNTLPKIQKIFHLFLSIKLRKSMGTEWSSSWKIINLNNIFTSSKTVQFILLFWTATNKFALFHLSSMDNFQRFHRTQRTFWLK